jgi:hypothetical protein
VPSRNWILIRQYAKQTYTIANCIVSYMPVEPWHESRATITPWYPDQVIRKLIKRNDGFDDDLNLVRMLIIRVTRSILKSGLYLSFFFPINFSRLAEKQETKRTTWAGALRQVLFFRILKVYGGPGLPRLHFRADIIALIAPYPPVTRTLHTEMIA